LYLKLKLQFAVGTQAQLHVRGRTVCLLKHTIDCCHQDNHEMEKLALVYDSSVLYNPFQALRCLP